MNDGHGTAAAAPQVNWPAIWTAIVAALAARGLVDQWQGMFLDGLPDFVGIMLQVGLVVSAITLLGGLYVIGLAWRRSPRFVFWFTVWQGFVIVETIGFQLATLTQSYFVQTVEPWLYALGQVVIGASMIVVARRQAVGTQTPTAPKGPTGPAPVGVYLINALLGLIGGGVLGGAVGLLFGAWIVDVMEVSCFEGGCGYAAVAIAFLFLLAGAVAGVVVAVRRTSRRG